LQPRTLTEIKILKLKNGMYLLISTTREEVHSMWDYVSPPGWISIPKVTTSLSVD
jgi:hypothetical protein